MGLTHHAAGIQLPDDCRGSFTALDDSQVLEQDTVDYI